MPTAIERLRLRAAELMAKGATEAEVGEQAKRLVEETLLLQTELAIQQDELSESHRRLDALHQHYRQLFESAPIGFVRVNSDGDIEDINEIARELLPIDARWRPPARLALTGFFPRQALSAWHELTRSEGAGARMTLFGRSGMLTADVRTVPWRGSEGGWLVVIDDVTELSEAQARQREAEERLGQVVQHMSDGLLIVDALTGVIEDHNQAFATMLGRPGESLVGSVHEDLFPTATKLFQSLSLREAMRDGRDLVRINYLHACGDERAADVSIGVVRERGMAHEYLVIRDATARLKAEETRRKMDARLAEAQKLEALGLLASGVAHDMNNVLAAVLTATELPPSPEILADLRAAALRGRELTERLLAVSRRKPLRSEGFDLLSVVDEVVGLTRRTFRREITIAYERPAETWMLEGDPGQWHQALLNVLINARDAIRDCGVIRLTTRIDGENATLVVQDDGEGMPPEVVRRAFEPFFTTKTDGRGTGLGLSHVRAVVTAHGGTTTLESSPDTGTSLRIAIRVSTGAMRDRPAVQPTVTPDEGAAPVVATRRVLVVDDEVFVCRAVSRLLTRLGWDVSAASSVAEAVEHLEKAAFDLVVTDRSMPYATGDQLCATIKARWPGTAMIVMTGLADEADIESLRALGVSSVLNKPFRGDELMDALARLGTLAAVSSSSGAAVLGP